MNNQTCFFKKIGNVSCLAKTGMKPALECLLKALFFNRVPDDKGNCVLLKFQEFPAVYTPVNSLKHRVCAGENGQPENVYRVSAQD